MLAKMMSSLKSFCQLCNLKYLIKVPTCSKKPDNFSVIDVILTSSHRSFQNTYSVETCLSDFHKMTVTILKTDFLKKKLK